MTTDLKKLERYHGHDRGVIVTQDANGVFNERPMTRAELAAREPAAAIQDDIFKHANMAGVCYYPIWRLITATIDTEVAALQQEVETLREVLTEARGILTELGWHTDRGLLSRIIEALQQHTGEDGETKV